MVPFGWSVGDIITGTKTLIQCLEAFKESGGAASKYQDSIQLLESLGNTLEHVKKYVEKYPTSAYASEIAAQVAKIEKSWTLLGKFLQQFDKTLGTTSSVSGLRQRTEKVFKTLKWTLKDLAGEIGNLRGVAAQPLDSLNSLLMLQILDDIEKHNEGQLTKDECETLLNQLPSSGLASDLERTISTILQCGRDSLQASESQQDEIRALRASFSEMESKLQNALSADGSIVDAVDGQSRVLSSMELKVIELSQAVLDMETESNISTQKLEQASKDQEMALIALRISVENQLREIENSRELHLSKDEPPPINWHSVLLNCMVTSITVSLAARRTLPSQNPYGPRPFPGPADHSTSEESLEVTSVPAKIASNIDHSSQSMSQVNELNHWSSSRSKSSEPRWNVGAWVRVRDSKDNASK